MFSSIFFTRRPLDGLLWLCAWLLLVAPLGGPATVSAEPAFFSEPSLLDIAGILPEEDPVVATLTASTPDELPSSAYSPLVQDSGYVCLLAVGAVGGLYLLPEDISRWLAKDRDLQYSRLTSRYWHNVSSGPVMDSDKLYINYLAHPYVGAAYYVRARHQHYSREEGLTYALWMSTVVYEYGIEAFFERPSQQDIVVTPLFGAICGEIFLCLERAIAANQGQILGSPLLGDMCLFLLDPLSGIIDPLKEVVNTHFNIQITQDYFLQLADPELDPPGPAADEPYDAPLYGLRLTFSRRAE